MNSIWDFTNSGGGGGCSDCMENRGAGRWGDGEWPGRVTIRIPEGRWVDFGMMKG